MSFSWKDRQAALDSLKENPPEVLIIGGGVVGCSMATHAAQLGLNVLLVERDDLASGASGNSTGLAHAGLRYLAQGRFLYVLHESRERQKLEELAPHWVRPFNFILPVYEDDSFSFGMVRLGTRIYDWFTRADALFNHRPPPRSPRVLNKEELLARLPGVRSEKLQGATEYFVDARLQDSRFTLGLAQQAARYGARIATYTEVTSLTALNEGMQKATLRDRLSGQTYELMVPLMINAAGAWMDAIRRTAGWQRPVVRMSKGIHLIVDYLTDTPLIFSTETKGRVFFVIPVDADRSLVGTTDTPVEGSPDEALPDQRDCQELIRRLFHFFPYLKQGSNLMEAMELYKQVHVRDVYWGIRPLVLQEGSTINASREHALVRDAPRIWSVPGVKLTASRAAGLQVAREAWKALRKSAPKTLETVPLPGGDMKSYERFVEEARKRFRLGDDSDAIVPYLVSMYGTRYVEVMRWVDDEPHYRERILAEEPWIPAQAAHAVEEEMALTLNDFLWRRTKWAHYRDIPEDGLYKIVNVMATRLNWSPDQVEEQIRQYREETKKHRL